MATKYWRGTAAAVAQVGKAVFATYDVTTTRKITIGGVTISAADSGGTLTSALSALATLLNASTDPRFSQITWTSNATEIIGTAKTAGLPFVFSGSVTGGTGTCSSAYTATTANAGPNDWSTAYNWSDGVVPVNGDTVYIQDGSVNICWGLDQSAVTLAALIIKKTYTGLIGLRHYEMAASANGLTATTIPANEYRDTYLKISATASDIGLFEGNGAVSGSQRIKIDFGSVSGQTCTVWGTASGSYDSGYPGVLILCNHANFILNVKGALAGVGIAKGIPGETSTLATLNVSEDISNSSVYFSDGVTITTVNQYAGTVILRAAAIITTVTIFSGTLTTEGNYTITTLAIKGGAVNCNHSGSVAITTVTFTLESGKTAVLDGTGSGVARTWSTVNACQGATVEVNKNVVTITTLVQPANISRTAWN